MYRFVDKIGSKGIVRSACKASIIWSTSHLMPDTPQKINWQKAALILQQGLEGEAIDSSVSEHLRQADHVLVACSGGADSVFLLCLLVARAQETVSYTHLTLPTILLV